MHKYQSSATVHDLSGPPFRDFKSPQVVQLVFPFQPRDPGSWPVCRQRVKSQLFQGTSLTKPGLWIYWTSISIVTAIMVGHHWKTMAIVTSEWHQPWLAFGRGSNPGAPPGLHQRKQKQRLALQMRLGLHRVELGSIPTPPSTDSFCCSFIPYTVTISMIMILTRCRMLQHQIWQPPIKIITWPTSIIPVDHGLFIIPESWFMKVN